MGCKWSAGLLYRNFLHFYLVFARKSSASVLLWIGGATRAGLFSCICRGCTLILTGVLSPKQNKAQETRLTLWQGVATQCGFSWAVNPPPYKNLNMASSKLVLPNIQPEAHKQCILRWELKEESWK